MSWTEFNFLLQSIIVIIITNASFNLSVYPFSILFLISVLFNSAESKFLYQFYLKVIWTFLVEVFEEIMWMVDLMQRWILL